MASIAQSPLRQEHPGDFPDPATIFDGAASFGLVSDIVEFGGGFQAMLSLSMADLPAADSPVADLCVAGSCVADLPVADLSDQQLRDFRDQVRTELGARHEATIKPLLSKRVELYSAIVEKDWSENRVAGDGNLRAGCSAYLGTAKRYGGHLMSLANFKTQKGQHSCPMCNQEVPPNANGKRAKDRKGMCKHCHRQYWQHYKDGWVYKWCQGCHKWEHISCFSPIEASKCEGEQIKAAGIKRARDEKKKTTKRARSSSLVCKLPCGSQ